MPDAESSPHTSPPDLRGFRVIEFTHAIMGPAAGLILADLGAEVIRIEKSPDGDDTRRLKGFGTGYYPFFNRNKKSFVVDLKAAAGRDIALQLIATADVVIENFAPHTMERLGLGYEALSGANPRLIYCALKGFLGGPYEDRAALDEVVQMMSGLAYMTGPRGTPLRAGASVIDILGATYAALGVIMALWERETTGRGRLVKAGLFETAAFVMGHHMAYAAISGQPVPPMPERVSAWSIYRPFETAGGELIFVGVTSDKHWRSFCDVFELADLRDDPRLATNNDRIAARGWVLPRLEAMFKRLGRDEALARCQRAAIPFAPVNHPEDLFDDEHLNASGALLDTRVSDGALATKLPRLPFTFDGVGGALRSDPPTIGQHTEALMRELGYNDDAIATFKRAGLLA